MLDPPIFLSDDITTLMTCMIRSTPFAILLLVCTLAGCGDEASDHEPIDASDAMTVGNDTTVEIGPLWSYPERTLTTRSEWEHEWDSTECPRFVSARWMDDALRSIRKRDTVGINRVLTEFWRLVDPATPSFNAPEPHPLLNIILIDLDHDGVSEAWINLLDRGWDGMGGGYDLMTCVAAQRSGGWEILYYKGSVEGKFVYQEPRFALSDPALIACEMVYVRNGMFTSEVEILKMNGGKIERIASLPGDRVIRAQTPQYLQYEIEAEISSIEREGIYLIYRYSLYPAVPDPAADTGTSPYSSPYKGAFEEAFLRGENYVSYLWNNDSNRYLLTWISSEVEAGDRDDTLTTRQLTTLLESDNPAEVTAVFYDEIDAIRRSATGRKAQLADYVLREAQERWNREAEWARKK